MGRGLSLTKDEGQEIEVLHEEGYNPTAIPRRMRSSPDAVRNGLYRLKTKTQARRPGTPRKLTSTAVRGLVRRACTGHHSAREVVSHFKLPVGVRRVQQVLHNAT